MPLLDGDGPRAITLSGARRLFRSLLSCFASTADQLARKKQKFGLGRKETLMVVTSRSPCWSRFYRREVSLWLLSKEQEYSYGHFNTSCIDITQEHSMKRKSCVHQGLHVLNLQLMLYLVNLTVNVLLLILDASRFAEHWVLRHV